MKAVKAVKANVKFEKENKHNFDCLFSISLLVYTSIFTDEYYQETMRSLGTIHPGIFRGRALSSDRAPRTQPRSQGLSSYRPLVRPTLRSNV